MPKFKNPIFENSEWAVTNYGLEAKTTIYLINKNRLLENIDSDYGWPSHMSEKNWCNLGLFVEAYNAAVEFHHHGKYDPTNLAKICEHGRKRKLATY